MRSDIDFKYFSERLEKRSQEIITEQQRQKDSTAPVELDQARVGRLSRMDAMQQQAMAKAASRLTELERQRIQSALLRMRDDEYGYCVICEEEIAEGRLEFDPSVLLCISCAEIEEAT